MQAQAARLRSSRGWPSSRLGLRVVGAWLVLALGIGAAWPMARAAEAEEPAATESPVEEDESFRRSLVKGFDACVLRPLRAGQMLTGFALFVASSPLTGLARSVPEAWDLLVIEPYESAFRTPLGQP